MVKLTTFAMMCKAYGGEPTIDLLRSFLNLGPAGDWFTLSNTGSADLLLSENKLDKKSFKDKVPLHPEMDPLYDQIAMYPCIVQTFPNPILYLAGLKTTWEHSPKRHVIYHRGHELDFKSFVLEGVDGEFNFLHAKGVSEGQDSPSAKYNVADSDDPSYGEDEQILVGPSLPPHPEASNKLKILGKRKVASGVPGKALPPKEIDSFKEDRAIVVSKVIPDATMKLVHSDDLHVLIAKLVRSSIIYDRCQAFKEVVAMKEPFVLEKMAGYRPSSKEEYDQAGDALANASYPFLA
ncbi:hypothetical protein Tco_0206057 [Tanacetum coccineum]